MAACTTKGSSAARGDDSTKPRCYYTPTVGRSIGNCETDDPIWVENVLDHGPQVLLVTGTAAIDPDPTKAAAVEEAKVVVADRAHDAPVVEGAPDPNQNC